MKHSTIFVIILFTVLLNGCDIFPDSHGRASGAVEKLFQYTDNNSSYPVDFLQTSGGYYLVVDESYTPFAHSIIKLDTDFNVLWKQTFEFTLFNELMELPNGDVLVSGGPMLIVVKGDGSKFTKIESIYGAELRTIQTDQSIIVYGSDANYKGFVAGYDLLLNKLWENNSRYNSRMVYDGSGNVFGLSGTADSIRQYALDGALVKDIHVQGTEPLMPTDIAVDESNNFIILGQTDVGNCCCNDKIGLYKIGPSGEKLWFKKFGSSNSNNYPASLFVGEGFYGITGSFGESSACIGEGFDGNPTNAYAGKINSDGSLAKEYFSGTSSAADGFSNMVKSNDQYFVSGGFSNSDLTSTAMIFRLLDF